MVKRSVVIAFRGFQISPSVAEDIIGVRAGLKAEKGDLVRPTSTTRYTRSVVRYSVELSDDASLRDVVPKLLEGLGGLENLVRARDIICPEYIDFSIYWPAASSEAQEGGEIPYESLRDLVELRCGLSFGFF